MRMFPDEKVSHAAAAPSSKFIGYPQMKTYQTRWTPISSHYHSPLVYHAQPAVTSQIRGLHQPTTLMNDFHYTPVRINPYYQPA